MYLLSDFYISISCTHLSYMISLSYILYQYLYMLLDLQIFYTSAQFIWILWIFVCILVLFLWLKNQKWILYLCFELVFEKVFIFFEGIAGKHVNREIVSYVVILFFIILMSNMLWVLIDILAPVFWINASGLFILYDSVMIPSSDLHFNLALAGLSIIIVLWVQFRAMGLKKFLYDYFPLFGKWYISLQKKPHTNKYLYFLQYAGVKGFDIILSLFLWVLEMIGLVAKVISLSFRLFGNMASGWVLLAITVVWLSWVTYNWFGFAFPVWLPVIVYLQEILVWLIQAFVFALLVAIFIGGAMPQKQEL